MPRHQNAIATATEAPAPAIKPRPIPKRIRLVVSLITSGECKNVRIAADRVGLHPDYVYRALKRSDVQVFAERAARQTIAAGVMRASARLTELMDAESEHVSFDAAKHVAALNGIKPASEPQVSVNIELKAGYVIDLSDTPGAPRDTQSRANEAQVIDEIAVDAK